MLGVSSVGIPSCALGGVLLPSRTFSVVFVCLAIVLLDIRPVVGQDQSKNVTKSQKDISVCQGTRDGATHSGTPASRYADYQKRYTKCTYLDGNLELIFLTDEQNYDLSFLKDIREVTGYILIISVYAEYIPLTNLHIVRGQDLFKHDEKFYSIYIALNYDKDEEHIGLRELGFVSLHEVVKGDIFIYDNAHLCHEDTIEWSDIMPETSKIVLNNTSRNMEKCKPCNDACRFKDNKLHCWGLGPDKCQNMTKIGCSPQCDGRCRGERPKDCCHKECAAGCTGATNADCLACKNFRNDGLCELFCPPEYIYSVEYYKFIPNPDAKYSYGSLCVVSCPSHLIAYSGACLKECEAKSININGKCVDCGGICPKTCPGSGANGVNARNIESFRDCTVIQGSIRILKFAFEGDAHENVSEMTVDQLSVLETVKEVSDYVQIQAKHENFTSLGFLRNLQVVHGRELISTTRTSFQIFDTSLEMLDLASLIKVSSGNIVVANNSNLCFANSMNWSAVVSLSSQMLYIQHNRNETDCANSGKVCAAECSHHGCWGPEDDNCLLECAHFRLGRRCIQSCDSVPLVYQSNVTECKHCHPECKSGCINDLSNSCDECLNVKDGPYCVPSCPEAKYPDQNSVCQSCHSNCEGGCNGSMNKVGAGACNSCAIAKYMAENQYEPVECLVPESECEVGFYKKWKLGAEYGPMKGKQGCIKCHSECQVCDGPGETQSCSKCLHVRENGHCVPNCSPGHYINLNTSNNDVMCVKCHQRCLECAGPLPSNCITCKEYMVYLDSENQDQGFECMETCPDHVPDKVTKETELGYMVTICILDEVGRIRKAAIISGCVFAGVAILTFAIVLGIFLIRKRAKTQKDNQKLKQKIQYGEQEMEPVSPSGQKPDLSQIRIIKESELRRGGILGSGAFGTVYKGLWIPENDNCKMIVAIKVLLEGTSKNQNEELISEARIMASVENDFCVRILAFCMASQMMIVTELMPHGCLLDFVRNNKKFIGSKLLLEWCTQIALGMDYLEQKSIVHRDLAARNVLLQDPNHIKITDFGLSKLLDHNENVVTYTGGKMPIKWLALESIQHKQFTHKSDVWSYGVTLWELFTYGQRPYETIDARCVPDLLEKGERLPQPSMCTIDSYMMLIKCWVLDASSRPSFKYLAQEFAKMSKESNRYLIIAEDNKKISLPDYTYDEKALLRSLSINGPEGPEKIVNPDDYIKPTTVHPPPVFPVSDKNANGGSRIQRERKSADKSGASSSPWKEQANGDRRKNSRYCSDPCKAAILQGHDQLFPGARLQNSANRLLPYNANGISEDPGLLQDDYLLPQQTNAPMKYLELSDENESDNTNTDDEVLPQTDHRAVKSLSSCISNPEYFEVPSNPSQDVQYKPRQSNRLPIRSKDYSNLEDERAKPLLLDRTSCV